MEIDLGDVTLSLNLRVHGLKRYGLVWRIGAVSDTTPDDRTVNGPPYHQPSGRIDLVMDLLADKAVPLSVQYTDEVGNPTDAPASASVAYTVDDPTIINLTDNGDGTGLAAAVGTLGVANVHVEAAFDGNTVTGDLQIVVVAGLAERVNVIAGEPVEADDDA
jgi:hypothetical protein